MNRQKLVHEDARSTTQKCLEIAEQMPLPVDQSETSRFVQEELLWTSKLVEDAAKESGLPTKSVLATQNQAPRRLANSNYLEQAFSVQLADLPLDQLARLLTSLDSDEARFAIKQLEISMPDTTSASNANSAGDEVWKCRNLTLSYFLISRKPSSK